MDFRMKGQYVAILCYCLALLPGALSFFCSPVDTENKQYKCMKWFGFTIARVDCNIYNGGLGVDCYGSFGCKEGTLMGSLKLCQKEPKFSVFVDVYEMEIYAQENDVSKATIPLGKMGVLNVTLSPTQLYGEGRLSVKLGTQTLLDKVVVDKKCKAKQFKNDNN